MSRRKYAVLVVDGCELHVFEPKPHDRRWYVTAPGIGTYDTSQAAAVYGSLRYWQAGTRGQGSGCYLPASAWERDDGIITDETRALLAGGAQ